MTERSCKVEKLSEEFFLEPISNKCDHIPDRCIKCLLSREKAALCPIENCGGIASDTLIRCMKSNLREMNLYKPEQTKKITATLPSACTLEISVLDGSNLSIAARTDMRVCELKEELSKSVKEKSTKLRLSFQSSEMKNELTLAECGIHNNCTLQLIILMMEEFDGKSYEALQFNLSWGFPDIGIDYLDGTCLSFAGKSFVALVDYKHLKGEGMAHTGDVMDEINMRGRHGISLHLPSVPSQITHLYFVLSAWTSPYISRYPKPTVQLHDRSRPDVPLPIYTPSDIGNVQALIMCRAVRRTATSWTVERVGRGCQGNAKNYNPIRQMIASIN